MTGFKPLSKHFSRQKSSAHFGEKREKGVSIRKPTSGLTVSKASGRQYCMQSIPLAVLKRKTYEFRASCDGLHAIHTACGIETLTPVKSSITNSVPLHAIHTACGIETAQAHAPTFRKVTLHAIHTACGIETRRTLFDTKMISAIACNPYRLRY